MADDAPQTRREHSLSEPLLYHDPMRRTSTSRAQGHVDRAVQLAPIVPRTAPDDPASTLVCSLRRFQRFTEVGLESYVYDVLTLRFQDPQAEARFEQMFYRGSLRSARAHIVLVAMTLFFFGCVDDPVPLWWVPAVVCVPVLALTWVRPRWLSYAARVKLCALPLLALLLFVYLEPRRHDEQVATREQARTVFVVWMSYVLTPLLVRHTVALNAIALAAWLASLAGGLQSLPDASILTMVHVFSNVVGAHAGYFRERLARKRFAVTIYYDSLTTFWRPPVHESARDLLRGAGDDAGAAEAAEEVLFWDTARTKTKRLLKTYVHPVTLRMPQPLEHGYRQELVLRSRLFVVCQLGLLVLMLLLFAAQDATVFTTDHDQLEDVLVARAVCAVPALGFLALALAQPLTDPQFQWALSFPYVCLQAFSLYVSSLLDKGESTGHTLYAISVLRAIMVVQSSRVRTTAIVLVNLLFLAVFVGLRLALVGVVDLHGYGAPLVCVTLVAGTAVAYLQEREFRLIYLMRFGHDRLQVIVAAHNSDPHAHLHHSLRLGEGGSGGLGSGGLGSGGLGSGGGEEVHDVM